MKKYTFTWKELMFAAAWAAKHMADRHGEGKDQFPKFALRNHGGSGIGINSAITCETCDAQRVSDANTHDITDYECW